jgi:phosphotransferase system enzyme I (PtsI)
VIDMVLKGIGVASGVVRGTAYVLVAALRLAVPRRDIGDAEVANELARFEEALVKAQEELLALEESLVERIGARDANIFGAQALLVRSSELVEPVRTLVREQRMNVEAAVVEVIERLVSAFDAVADPHLREHAADIRDIGRRVLSLLATEQQQWDGAGIPEHSIVVAEELLPSVTVWRR